MVKERGRVLITGLMEINMLDNLKTQKDMVKVHISTQEEIAGQVNGDGGKRPKIILITNLLKKNLFTIHI